MSLIAILVAMATEGFWKSVPWLGKFRGVVRFAQWLHVQFGKSAWINGAVGVLVTIGPGILLVAIIQNFLSAGDGVLRWILLLVFSVAVLVFCIGVRGLNHQIDQYITALRRGDPEGAYLYVREILADARATNPAEANRKLLENILIRNNERLLAILFWFVLLGPAGAFMYRSTTQLKALEGGEREGFLEAVFRLQAILDWMPARITAICYAVIGSFEDAIHNWRTQADVWGEDLRTRNQGVLVASGLGALRLEEAPAQGEDLEVFCERIEDAQAMVRRTVIAWLTVFALLTIAGWLA
jgi:AmpE protein